MALRKTRNPRRYDAGRWKNRAWEQVRVLDPQTAPTVQSEDDDGDTLPTVYIGPRVLVPRSAEESGVIELLKAAAAELGWRLESPREDGRTKELSNGVLVLTIKVDKG